MCVNAQRSSHRQGNVSFNAAGNHSRNSSDHDWRMALAKTCLVSACLLRTHHKSDTPTSFFIDSEFPLAARAFLRHVLRIDTPLIERWQWPKSKRFPRAVERAYTFNKLQAWKRLPAGDTVLWFDTDLFWARDPGQLFDLYTPFALMYFNTGLMLFVPNARDHAELLGNWSAGTFNDVPPVVGPKWVASKLTEQDLLRTVFRNRVHHMDSCVNFRGFIDGRSQLHDRNTLSSRMNSSLSPCTAPFGMHQLRFLPWAERELRNRTGPCAGSILEHTLQRIAKELQSPSPSQQAQKKVDARKTTQSSPRGEGAEKSQASGSSPKPPTSLNVLWPKFNPRPLYPQRHRVMCTTRTTSGCIRAVRVAREP